MSVIETKPYGKIEVSDKQKITFIDGIIGFPDNKEYYLLDSPKSPFLWLQSAEKPELAFLVISPLSFRKEYDPAIDKKDLKAIGIESETDIVHLAIVTVPSDPSKMSANLQGPIIVNKKNRKAKQIVCNDDKYQIKHYIIDEMKQSDINILSAKKSMGTQENAVGGIL